jgi:hypothetical protein
MRPEHICDDVAMVRRDVRRSARGGHPGWDAFPRTERFVRYELVSGDRKKGWKVIELSGTTALDGRPRFHMWVTAIGFHRVRINTCLKPRCGSLADEERTIVKTYGPLWKVVY